MEIPKIKITTDLIKQSKTLTCDCGGMLFQPGVVYKKISAFISPSGQEEMVPLEVLICIKCNKVPTELDIGKILPSEVLAEKSKIIKHDNIDDDGPDRGDC